MKAVVLAIILAVCIASAYGLSCYQCYADKSRGIDCSKLEDAEPVECKPDATLCTKFIIDGEVTRSCFSQGNSDKKVGCRSVEGLDGSTTTDCFCSGNYCNSANSISGFKPIHLAITVVTLLLKCIIQ